MQITCAAAANETSVRIMGIPEKEKEKEGENPLHFGLCVSVHLKIFVALQRIPFNCTQWRVCIVGYGVDCRARTLRNHLDDIANRTCLQTSRFFSLSCIACNLLAIKLLDPESWLIACLLMRSVYSLLCIVYGWRDHNLQRLFGIRSHF